MSLKSQAMKTNNAFSYYARCLTTAWATKLLPLLLLLILPYMAQGQSYTNSYGIWGYTTTNASITITNYSGPGGAVTIPNTINGVPVICIGVEAFFGCALFSVAIPDSVTSIGDRAFGECWNLTSVTIPDSVTSIGAGAFSATSLTSVTIPNSVTSIGDYAFGSCTSLTSITIPNSVTSIGNWAFADCGSLTAITVDTRNSVYSDVDGVLFNQSLTTLIQYPGGITGAYTIPNSVTNIGVRAFDGCGGLTSITIPNSVTSIGNWAFDGCLSLTSVYFQGNAPSFGVNVFVSVGLGSEPTFWDPATIYCLPGTTGWDQVTDETGLPAFLWDPPSQAGYTTNNGTVTITRYTGPDTSWTIPTTLNGLPVNSIGSFLCSSLTNVTIPRTVTNVAGGAFSSCSSLTAITVDTNNPAYSSVNGVLFDKIETAVVEYPCGLGGSYTIPSTVTKIGDSAFSDCTSLSSVTIPNSVTNIGDSAFSLCTSLTSVYFQGNAPSLGADVFDSWQQGQFMQWQVWDPATIYYLPGTAGWSTTFAGIPVVLWTPQVQNSDASFGVRSNQFGFNINWASGMSVVVEACTNLANPTWSPISTNTLTSGTAYFSDAQWTNYPRRFYRIHSP